MEREARIFIDDLDFALVLISNISTLYARMKESDQSKLLHVIARRIMIDSEGEIIDHELHSPFAYLRSLVDEFSTKNSPECGSEQPLGGAQMKPISNHSIPQFEMISLNFQESQKINLSKSISQSRMLPG